MDIAITTKVYEQPATIWPRTSLLCLFRWGMELHPSSACRPRVRPALVPLGPPWLIDLPCSSCLPDTASRLRPLAVWL